MLLSMIYDMTSRGKIGILAAAAFGACHHLQMDELLGVGHSPSEKYADQFDFDVLPLENDYSPEVYTSAISFCEGQGYEVIIVDSLSHAWTGKGGALELVDNASKKYKGNSYVAWREVTPMHRDLVEAMLQSKAHIIGTMRSKTEYVQEKNDRGKTVIRKVGMAPIQREGMDYEFDIVFDMDWDHNAIVSKSRCFTLADQVFHKPGDDVTKIILDWLTEGKPADTEEQIVAEKIGPSDRPKGMPAAKSQHALLMWARQNYDMSGAQVGEALKAAGFSKFDPGRWEDMVEAVVMAGNGSED
jgi:hypothetical protein